MTEVGADRVDPPTAEPIDAPIADGAEESASEADRGAAQDESPESDFGQQSLLPPATTGEPGVDAALAHLHDLEEQPVTEHVAAFERVHAALAEALSDQPPTD